jgi:16S rRNA (cytosine967-C5)-methyltransferase
MHVTGSLTRGITAGRRAAFVVLEAVAGGAYASDELRAQTRLLSPRDAGLAGQIVFGSLRFQGQLDYLISHYSGRPARDLDPIVRIALRTAIFQLRYLERVPAYAAVNDSVELVKRRKRAASGLTNAVLRKVDRQPLPWPDEETALSCPGWMLARWARHFDADLSKAIAAAALIEPGSYFRLHAGEELPAGVEAERAEVPGSYRLLSGTSAGLHLQDISSQTIVPLLELEAGHSFLDLCAAPGNKTRQAAETPLRLAVAGDISASRLAELPRDWNRVLFDAAAPLPFANLFDRILLDAPCSGTGTLGRNPEIKWRVTEKDFARFGAKQRHMAAQAVRQLAPGGVLVYATCSLEREENEEVVQATAEVHPELQLEREVWRLPGREPGDGFYAAVFRRA